MDDVSDASFFSHVTLITYRSVYRIVVSPFCSFAEKTSFSCESQRRLEQALGL